ncbi:MAG: hypothetical protein AAGJ97_14425 [Planctomycetota bacterium]
MTTTAEIAEAEDRADTLAGQVDGLADDAYSMMTEELMKKLGRFARLTNLQREAEELIKKVKAALNAVGEACLEDMALAACDRATVQGLTLAPHETFYASKAKDVTPLQLAEACHAAGVGEFVKGERVEDEVDGSVIYMTGEPDVPMATLKAWLNEQKKAGQPVPAEIAEVVNFGTKVELRATKATRKAAD